ncbi:MAG: hypothetical protein R2784_08055 [Saprospiraceae bacterium]
MPFESKEDLKWFGMFSLATACNTNDGRISLVSALEHITNIDVSANLVFTWNGPNGYYLQGSVGTAGTISGLEPGTYYVRVDNPDGCFYDFELDVLAPNNLGLNALVAYNAHCSQNDGGIHVELVGGTAPYTYNFYNVAYSLVATQTSNDPFTYQWDLGEGKYTMIAEDANGCMAAGEIILDALEGPEINISATSLTDCGNANGDVTFSIFGDAPFQYEIFGDDPYPGGTIFTSGTPVTIQFLPAGNYVLQVMDANGCTSISEFEIIGLDPFFNIDITTIDGVCPYSPNGATVAPQGQFIVNSPLGATYNYTWIGPDGDPFSPADPTNPTDLPNGCYKLYVTDGTCVDSIDLLMNPSNGPQIIPFGSADASCPMQITVPSALPQLVRSPSFNIHNTTSQDGIVLSGDLIIGQCRFEYVGCGYLQTSGKRPL